MEKTQNKTQKKGIKAQAAQAVEDLGGSFNLPLIVSQYMAMGSNQAEKITPEQIAQAVENQKEKERQAEARGFVCLMSADFVGWLFENVAKFAKMPATVRAYLIKQYLK